MVRHPQKFGTQVADLRDYAAPSSVAEVAQSPGSLTLSFVLLPPEGLRIPAPGQTDFRQGTKQECPWRAPGLQSACLPSFLLALPQARCLHLPAQAPPTPPQLLPSKQHQFAPPHPLRVYILPLEEDAWQRLAAQPPETSWGLVSEQEIQILGAQNVIRKWGS